MTGRSQIRAIVREMELHPERIPDGRFTFTRSGRIACTICGRDGVHGIIATPVPGAPDWRGYARRWSEWFPWAPWQVSCLRDHTWPCSCGRFFPEFVNLWLHIGADRPNGWGRQGEHRPVLAEPWPQAEVTA